LDTGTRILLETVLEQEKDPLSTLDLGCGIGVIGIVLLSNWKTAMTMIDINERAVELTKSNLQKYQLQASVYAQSGIVQDTKFECILLNPPIRTGKKMIYSLFDQCVEHLAKDGRFWIVMRKQHGAQSAISYLEEKGCIVERVVRDKGYWIMKIEKAD
ncbi:MAG: methyltransferase, partial [Holdemanella sp.]|nr:methyltransferase [Holdemanella sp.]